MGITIPTSQDSMFKIILSKSLINMRLLVPVLVILSFVTCQAEKPILNAIMKLQKQVESSNAKVSNGSSTVPPSTVPPTTVPPTTVPPTTAAPVFKCYECDSEDDDWCTNSDAIIDHKVNATECSLGCFYAWTKMNGTEYTGRSCAEEYDIVGDIVPNDCLKMKAYEDHDLEFQLCFCNSDYCNDKEIGNSAHKLGITAMTGMIAIIVTMIWQ